jgi:8-hydroxy-5-deazaflavin:NADPH oxidoreductase
MRIAILGSGNVGGTLGRGWAKKGHEVTFGARDASDPKLANLLAETGGKARAAAIGQAAGSADVVALAVPWDAVASALRSAGSLQGKIVLDCTNPLKPDMSGLEVGLSTSGAEQVADLAAGAKVVKIFNTTGFNNMANPRYGNEPATMFYCGDDARAKAVAGQLAADLGFEPVDAGSLAEARLLEPYALLWIHLAVMQKLGRDIAFKLMRR